MREPRKPSGWCYNGHNQVICAFIDSEGDWRCRECRKIANRERDFWKLVKRYTDDPTDEEAFSKLTRFHWNEP